MPDIEAAFRRGLSHQRDGRPEEAAAAYREVLISAPDHAGALHNLGVLMRQAGRVEEAIRLIGRAAVLDPQSSAVAFSLGVALAAAGRYGEAADAFGRSFLLKPELATLQRQVAALRAAGRPQDAIAACRAAVLAHPDEMALLFQLAATLQDLGRLAEAETVYREVVARAPTLVEGHANLGSVLSDLGRPDEAAACYGEALSIRPGQAAVLANLGTVLSTLGRHDEAEALLRRSLSLRPGHAMTECNLAFALLRRGDLASGWRVYEGRWRLPEMRRAVPALPRWQGDSPAGRSILLVAEQGLGDTLQFIRYAPLLARQGARVVLECQPGLVRLMGRIPGLAEVRTQGTERTGVDCWCPVMSLPHAFATTLTTIPATMPYLAADPGEVDVWRRRIEALTGVGVRRVGLVWAGAARPDIPKAHLTDRRRSLSLEHFAVLAGIAGIRLVSLQKGEPAGQLVDAPAGLDIVDPMPLVQDFADTAALVQALDLVITVDTSVAHLAAGMGRPVWMLSRFDACWRWLWGRDDSPWYPSMRIFRQTQPAQWGPALADLAAALKAWAHG